MRVVVCLFLLVFVAAAPSRIEAAEGGTIAGVVGGNDIRAALPAPPGLYVAGAAAFSHTEKFFDGRGRAVTALNGLEFDEYIGAIGALYVPDLTFYGGTFGLIASLSGRRECGQISAFTANRCVQGFGDPFFELNWSRFFGSYRASQFQGALPIAEGLAIQFGLGVVVPTGSYDVLEATTAGLAIGNNVWDIAPTAALTYTTPALISDGTEISAKLYWNNFIENSATSYRTGDLLSVDFAITERIGKLQIGLTGLYAEQIEDDRQFGVTVAPDGRRVKGLSLGLVVNYDLPEYASTIKFKALTAVSQKNSVAGGGGSIVYAMKLY